MILLCFNLDAHMVRNQILQQLSARSDVEEKEKEEVTSKDFNRKQCWSFVSGVCEPSGWVFPCLHWDWLQQRRRNSDSETLWTPAVPRRPSLADLPEVTYLGAVFCEDSWICSINDVLNIPSMQVLWPPWDKTTKPHLCSWILPQRDYWESWRSFTESTWKPLLKLRNQSNLILFKTHHAIARLIQMQVLIREDVQTVAKFIKEEVATRSLLPDSPKVLHGVLNLQISKEIKPKWLKRKGRHN